MKAKRIPIGQELHAPELVVRSTTDPKGLQPLTDLDRRSLLRGSSLLLAGSALPGVHVRPTSPRTGRTLPAFYEDIEQRTFRFFWETVNRNNGLVPDRWPTPSFSSIAAVGFALTAYPVGVERGWCIAGRSARPDADDAALLLERAAGAGARAGTTGHKGFFYHFLDMQTGHRYRTSSCRASTPRSC